MRERDGWHRGAGSGRCEVLKGERLGGKDERRESRAEEVKLCAGHLGPDTEPIY